MPESDNVNNSSKRGGKGKLRHEDNPKPFTSENQPSPEAKKQGKWKAKTLKEFLTMPVGKSLDPEHEAVIQRLCDAYGVPRDYVDNKLLMELSIAQKAHEQGDEARYKALCDRAFGKPRNEGWDAPPPVEEAPDRQKSVIDLGNGIIFEI